MQTLTASILADRLSKRKAQVLTWFGPGKPSEPANQRERVELGGPVARRWLAKTDNFLDSEFPFGATEFSVLLPNHWRTPFWLIAPWLRGLKLCDGGDASGADMAISNDIDYLTTLSDEGGPDTLIAQTTDSFALAWPEALPFGILDGTADISSYGDEVEVPFAAPADALLLAENWDWLPPDLSADPAKGNLQIADLTQKDYVGTLALVRDIDATNAAPTSVGRGSEDLPAADLLDDSSLAGARVLVTTDSPVLFTVQLVQLWLRGASVVWVPGGGDLGNLLEVERVTHRATNA